MWQRGADSQKDSEREAALKSSLEELGAKNKEAALLQNKVAELEQKLQQAQAKLKVSLYSKATSVNCYNISHQTYLHLNTLFLILLHLAKLLN